MIGFIQLFFCYFFYWITSIQQKYEMIVDIVDINQIYHYPNKFLQENCYNPKMNLVNLRFGFGYVAT